MRRMVLFGSVLFAATAAVAAAASGGLTNIKLVLLGRDDQINELVTKRKLTLKVAHVVLDAPILEVGKGG